MILSERNRSSVVRRDGEWVFKIQPKHLTQNEIYALEMMRPSGYVPHAKRVDLEVIRMEYVDPMPITDKAAFMAHYEAILSALKGAGLRHGDLTKYAVLPVDNTPIIIDWAESRLWDDPRPDKRPEGDRYWLRKTMEKLCAR